MDQYDRSYSSGMKRKLGILGLLAPGSYLVTIIDESQRKATIKVEKE